MPISIELGTTLVVSCLGSFALTALARFVAPRIGFLDHPNHRKAHHQPMPLLGGVAFFVTFCGSILIATQFGVAGIGADAESLSFLIVLLISASLFCTLGLYDDKNWLNPRTKFMLQILCTLPFVLGTPHIDSIRFLGFDMELGPFGAIFTIFWLVACANVLNLVDGLDGLAGTTCIIVSLAVAAQASMHHIVGIAPLALILAASLLGFLIHNWPPAKIYLGDSGSLTIGYLVGALSLASSLKTSIGFALAVPLVLISVPIFDTLMAILRRKLNGRGIAQADREHIHHCLQERGLSRTQSLITLIGLCLVMAGVALTSEYFNSDWLGLGICGSLLGLLVVQRIFGYNEILQALHHFQALGRSLVETSRLAELNQDDASNETFEDDPAFPVTLPLQSQLEHPLLQSERKAA